VKTAIGPRFSEEGDPRIKAAFRGRAWRQINLPFLTGLAIVLAGAVFFLSQGIGTASLWADISLVFLIMPVLAFGLLFLVLLSGIAYAVIWLIRWLPIRAERVGRAAEQVAGATKRGTKTFTSPLLAAGASIAALKALLTGVAGFFRRKG